MLSTTKSFVEELVKEPILNYATSQGTNKGDNNAGELLGITVTTEANNKIHLIYKSLSDESDAIRSYAELTQIFVKEKLFYSSIIPLMQNLATSRGYKETLPFPKYYGGSSERYKEFICLEDLRQSPSGNYKMGNKWNGLSLEETRLVMAELGKYHALSYFLLQWEGEKLLESTEDFKVLQSKRFGDFVECDKKEAELLQNLFQVGTGLIEERDPKLAAKMRAFDFGSTMETIMKTTTLTESKYFPVIIHGDLWINNIMMRYNKQNQPEDLVFIDFQLIRRGNIFEDLLYFIFTSTTPAFREQYLHQVLNLYFDSFKSTLDTINWPLPANFTRGVLFDGFQQAYLCAYKYLFLAIPFQLGAPVDLSNDAMIPNNKQNGHAKQNGNAKENGHAKQNGDKAKEAPEWFDRSIVYIPTKISFENSTAAIDRLEAVTREMVKLNFL